MAHDEVTRFLGIVNQFNPLSIQPGSAARADNCVNLRENVVEDRRGYKVDATLANAIEQVIQYNGKVLAHNGNVMSYGPSSYANYAGTYNAPANSKIRYAEANTNLYITTDEGIKVFTDTTGTAARKAGAPRSLDPSYTLNAAGAGFLSNSSQCAYRTVIQRTDANSNVLFGYPSQRLWVPNASGTGKNVDLVQPLPSECIAGDVIQFYRTAQVAGTSSDDSGDEMGLVYQVSLTAADITAGSISFTDSITDELRGATLYTSPSQETILQANERPPLAKDIALFRSSYMFLANCSTKQRLFITLVGTASLSGKTITLAGVTYNFGGSEITSGVGSPQALVGSTGVLAADIDSTARSLVRVINRYASNTSVYAYYLTGPDDLPGQILIEERGVGAAAFTAQASDTAISGMFFPAPPVSPATNSKSTSSNSIQKNALQYSKFQQPEHMPIGNNIPVGPSNKEILRIIPLRESMVIIKEEGVYRLTGDSPQSFAVTPLDLTVFCKSADSVALVSNQVFMLSNQGIVSISETGIEVISRNIEPSIKKLLQKSDIADYTYGAGYESDRQYLISSVTDSSDTAANQTLVYNVFTKTWVRWTFAFSTAVVEPVSDKLYFGKSAQETVYVERKSNTFEDFADPETDIEITALDGRNVSFTIAGAQPDVGWVISQNGTENTIESIMTVGTEYVATMVSELPDSWETGDAIIYPSVSMDLEWNPWTAGTPGLLKQARCAKILTDSTVGENSSTLLEATFRSNFDAEISEVPLSQAGFGWGGPWGSMAWGGGSDSYGYPTWVPANKQYCTRLFLGVRHKNAREKVSIVGYAFDYEQVSDRIGT